MTDYATDQLFSKLNSHQRHLYNRDSFSNVEHRRTLSTNLEQIKASISHKRTQSGNPKVVSHGKHIENMYGSPPPRSEKHLQNATGKTVRMNLRKRCRGFLGMLNAAIQYFDSETIDSSNQLQEIRRNLQQLDKRIQTNHKNTEILFKKYVKIKDDFTIQDGISDILSQDTVTSKTKDLEIALQQAQQQLAYQKEKNRKLQAKLYFDISKNSNLLNSSGSDQDEFNHYLQIPPSQRFDAQKPTHRPSNSISSSGQSSNSLGVRHMRTSSQRLNRGRIVKEGKIVNHSLSREGAIGRIGKEGKIGNHSLSREGAIGRIGKEGKIENHSLSREGAIGRIGNPGFRIGKVN